MTQPVIRKDLLTAIISSAKSVSKVEIQKVTIGPWGKAPLHLHPCPTLRVISEGTISFQIEGEPIRRLKEGEAFYEPADVRVAMFNNDTDMPAKFVVFNLSIQNFFRGPLYCFRHIEGKR